MGELLDRPLQLRLLRTLSWTYPNSSDVEQAFQDIPENHVRVNLCYLEEHRLVSLDKQRLDEGLLVTDATITAKGLDFLADDGGLGAILGVVMVKIHDDTIKELLADRVRETVKDLGVRDRLLEAIKDLPAEGVKDIAKGLLSRGAQALTAEMIMGWFGL